LRAAAAIEDDGEVADLKVSDCVAMGMAMEIEPNARVALEEFLQSCAPSEIAARLVVLKEGVVIEHEDRFGGGNELQNLFYV
jgi:hypothetical protein